MLRRSSLLLIVTLLAGCGVAEEGVPTPDDALTFPVSLAAHPDGRYLYIANAVFDRRYRNGTVLVYDTQAGALLPGATVATGLFAGELVVGRHAPEGPVFGYLGSRDANELVQFDVDAAAGDTNTHLSRASGATSFGGRSFAGDPYGIAIDGEGVTVTHLARGVVSRWGVDADQGLVFRCSLTLAEGATSVARHPVLGTWYVTDRSGGRVEVLAEQVPAAPLGGISETPCELKLVSTLSVAPGTSRGLAFSADGSRLYLAGGTEGALRIYDTTVGTNGRARNRLMASVPVGNQPSQVRVSGCRPCECPNAERDCDPLTAVPDGSAPAKRGGLVYVSMFEDDLVLVVDPDALAVIGRIKTGRGPHALEFMLGAGEKLRGYVANFDEGTVSVLDLDPDSADRFTVIDTIP